jgi:hypothetical protein
VNALTAALLALGAYPGARQLVADVRHRLGIVTDASLDYHEAVQVLNGWTDELVAVYPHVGLPAGELPSQGTTAFGGLAAWGTFKPLGDPVAATRRRLSDAYTKIRPELALGDAPLELYERQVAYFTFEGMDTDLERSYVGFAIWEHEFVEARWLDFGGRFNWLWVNAHPYGVIVAQEFEPLPS